MTKAPANIRSLARLHSPAAIRVLADIAKHGENEGARVSAAIHLLDRGWGKAAQTIGANGDGEIKVIIRHIVEGRDIGEISEQPLVIEHEKDRDTS